MIPSRRGILGLLGMAPIAGKAAADQVVSDLMGINPAPSGFSRSIDVPPSVGVPSEKTPINEGQLLRNAWRVPALREEMETLLYEQNRRVTAFDHDIANKRSFSMAAKIVFQRQRDVERVLEVDWFENHPWQRRRKLFQRLVKTVFS